MGRFETPKDECVQLKDGRWWNYKSGICGATLENNRNKKQISSNKKSLLDDLNESWDDSKKALNNSLDDVKREYWDSWNLKDMAFWEGGKKITRQRRNIKKRTRKKRTRKKRTRKIKNHKKLKTYRKKIKSKKLNGGNKLSRTLCSSWGSLWGTKECGEKIREYKQMLTNMNKMDNLTKLLVLSEFIGEGNAIQAMGGINNVNKILNVNDKTKKQLIKIIKEKKLNHI